MKRKNAFTLIELLAVIAVIAILTIIAVPNVMKLYKESKKNMFITQVRKTAKSAQLEYAEGTKNTFDCNKDLSGQKYKECTGTVDEDDVTITALGDGEYSNFLMVDVTSEPDSGVFIDLEQLNLIEIEKPNSFKESLIKDNAINPIFRSISGKELVDAILEIEFKAMESQGYEKPEITEEIQQEINIIAEQLDKMRNNNIISNNKMKQKENININENKELSYSTGPLKNNLVALSLVDNKMKISSNISKVQSQKELIKKVSNDKNDYLIANSSENNSINILVYELNIDSKMAGTYEVKTFDYPMGMVIKESDMEKALDNGEFSPTILSEELPIDLTNAEKAYFVVITKYGEEYEGLTIEKSNSANDLQLIGKSTIDLDINNIKAYVDDGVKNKNKKLVNEGDFYSYNNIRHREGNFTYNYVVKTNEGVKILKRKVNVYADTSLDCFDFELNYDGKSYNISRYYEYEKNDNTKKACPKRIYIPNEYKNLNITGIYSYAFDDMGILSVRLPDKLKEIGYNAFSKNFIETLTLPSSLIEIEDYAFIYNNINYIEYNGNRKFCNQSIGAQRYNKLYLFDDFDYVDFWNQNIYTGRTSKQFLKTCTPRPAE